MLNKPKVLIVDDRPENIFAMKKTLRKVDADLLTADSGSEALSATLKNDFALILLDVQMPDMNGYEVAELLRTEENTRNIPIIFVTAIDREEEREVKGYDSGAVDYIFKPVNAQVLLGKVNIFLELYQNRQKLLQYGEELELKVTERTKELEEYRDNLEKLVEERTSKLKETQTQLVQSAKLASIGTLASGVAHELNQPLSYIRGSAQMEIEGGMEDFDLKSAYETLKLVVEGSFKMESIINHLREFARNEGSMPHSSVSLPDILDSSFALLNKQFEIRGIKITREFPEDLPQVYANPNQLEQVFINVLSNARDALKKTDSPQVSISAEQNNGNLTMIFSDNGPGISPDAVNKVFDPFFTTKEIGKGTGLGLSISYGIIKDHKGDIAVTSEPGKGAAFKITLPLFKEDGTGDQ